MKACPHFVEEWQYFYGRHLTRDDGAWKDAGGDLRMICSGTYIFCLC